jgi:hypothetical protein
MTAVNSPYFDCDIFEMPPHGFLNGFFVVPGFDRTGHINFIVIPWWLVMMGLLPCTYLVWYFTKRSENRGGFPVLPG